MNRAGPRRWLVLAIGAALVAGILTAGVIVTRPHGGQPAVAGTSPVSSTIVADGVELHTTLSLRLTGSLTEVVAHVSILNTTDRPIAYVGGACADPASVSFQSTRTIPDGPGYGASAAALRRQVMEYRRSLDEALAFSDESEESPSCDDSAPPLLAPHVQLDYVLSSGLASPGYPDVDSATTDVVTAVHLGDLVAGRPDLPITPGGAVTLRVPLASLATVVKPSAADYALADADFAAVMRRPDAAAWIAAQEASSWHDVRLVGSLQGRWQLVAFSTAWALPLKVSGAAEGAIDSISIPREPIAQRPAVAASVPPASAAVPDGYLPDRDVYAGDLTVPSGVVMVGDPVSTSRMLKFSYGLAAGSYPVDVVTARPVYLAEDYARPAYEELMLSGEAVVRWEPAIPVGHSAGELKPGELFTWSTDGGSAGFASPEAMRYVDATLSEDDFGIYGELGDREAANRWQWAFVTADAKNGANVFGCESGFGDGVYPVMLGVDARGRPAELLSDFGVLRLDFTGLR